MDRLLGSDLAIKIISVFLALTFWLLATGARGEVQKPIYDVPVRVRNLGSELALTGIDPGAVTVTIRAGREGANALDRSTVDAYVNLTGSRPGRFGLEVQVTVPVGATLVDISPKIVDVTLESMVEKDVPVSINVVGTPAADFEIGGVSTETETARLRGPESEVARAARAVGQLSIEGASDDVNAEVRIFPQDDEGENLNQTVVIPAYVDVTVTLSEVRVEKEVAVSPTIVGRPESGYTVGDVNADPQSVRVLGARSVIEQLESVSTAELSVEGVKADVSDTVQVVLPEGVDRAVPPTVTVRVNIVSE